MPSPQNDAASAGSSQLGRSASDLGEQVQETAGRIADSQISKQKENATGVLEQVAEAIQRTGEQLRGGPQERISRYALQAADKVRQFSGSIRGADPRDVLRRAEDLARREPALFLGGAFALGLIGARFLKSSDRASSHAHSPRSFPPLDQSRAAEGYGAERVGAGTSGEGGAGTSGDLGLDEDEDLRGSMDGLSGIGRGH
jgi:hypothetical protein